MRLFGHVVAEGRRRIADLGARLGGDSAISAAYASALVEAYRPLMRALLLPILFFHIGISLFAVARAEGQHQLVLVALSAATAAVLIWAWRVWSLPEATSLWRHERNAFFVNLAILANTAVHLADSFDPTKLVYFAVMPVLFAATAVSVRGAAIAATLSLGVLLTFLPGLPPTTAQRFVFVTILLSVLGLWTAHLLRRALHRQVEARLMIHAFAAEAQQQAVTDPLTQIPNRRAMFDLMDRYVQAGTPFWLGIVDLDGFKAVNDVYGHAVGDALLREAAARITSAAGKSAVVGRIGGDEFALVVNGDADEVEVRDLGDDLIMALSAPFEIDFARLSVSATIGFAARTPADGSAGEIYERADFALYGAKAENRGQSAVFDAVNDKVMADTKSLERALREADLEAELNLVYQPQFSLREDRIIGFEALARWVSPTLGPVPPDKFIRAAERSGLISRVTTVLFARGLKAMALWPDEIHLSFNLSGHDVCDAGVLHSLVDLVRAQGVAPQRIEFEITETAVMSDIEHSAANLRQLQAQGFGIALDDFGSGYSSFEYIDRLPLSKIKIDKSFVRKVSESRTSGAIVAAVLGLCRTLELRCVLEGVETRAELARLEPLQPDLIQGYLFGKPMALIETLAALAHQEEPLAQRG